MPYSHGCAREDNEHPTDDEMARMLSGQWVVWQIPMGDGTYRPRRMRYVSGAPEIHDYILLKGGGFKVRYIRLTEEGTVIGEVLAA